jgi:dTMP kinase
MGATLRGKNRRLLTPTTFCLVHATDFADRYERQILPMLKGGCIVLCDRYVYTAYVRDGVRGCDPAWLRSLYGFARTPDVTVYFDLPLHAALGRVLEDRTPLSYFEAGMDLGLSADMHENYRLYQGRVLEQYRRLAAEFDFVTQEATRTIHDQQNALRELITSRLDLDRFKARGIT